MWPASGQLERNQLLCGFIVQAQADVHGTGRIHCAVILHNVLDHALLVDHECRATREFVLVHFQIVGFEDSVRFQHLVIHVAEERKGDADLLGKGAVGGGAIDADSENDCVTSFQLGQIRLIGL